MVLPSLFNENCLSSSVCTSGYGASCIRTRGVLVVVAEVVRSHPGAEKFLYALKACLVDLGGCVASPDNARGYWGDRWFVLNTST